MQDPQGLMCSFVVFFGQKDSIVVDKFIECCGSVCKRILYLPFLYSYSVYLDGLLLLPAIQIDSMCAMLLQVLERDGKV